MLKLNNNIDTHSNSLLKYSVLLFGFVFLLNNQGAAQNYGDKTFYLLDSLDLNSLTNQDRILIDTSLTLYHNTKEDTAKFQILEHIVDECWNNKVWPRYNDLLIEQVNHKLATNCSKKERSKTIHFMAGAVSNVGFLHDQKGDLLNALNYYHKSLQLYELVKDDAGTSTLFNNLGVLYSMIGDTSKALEYHNKSLITKRLLGDLKGVSMSYNNIGTVYENVDMPFVALEYYESSLKIRTQINDQRGIAMSYDNIGDVYYSEDINGKAYEYYNKGYLIWKALENEIGISTSLDNLSNVLLRLNRNKEAKAYATESLKIAEKLGYAIDIENSSKTLANVYRIEKNYELALKYNDLYLIMRDKTKNIKNNNLALKKSMQYEYQKVALKDSLELIKEREVHHLKIQEKETQAIALYGGIGLLIIILFIAIKSFLRKKSDNKKINQQKIEVESQKLKIENQHLALAATHKEISDSISYAKRIQDAILPTKEILNHHLKNGFVFFQPKDIVSGDFYWIEKVNDLIIFAAADCTGHGVPGAMVSVVCHNALNRSVREFKFIEPAKILDNTRRIIIETFSRSQDNVKDGMDISICCWDTKSNIIQWAGANNPLYIIRDSTQNKKIEIISPDKQPVGKFELAKNFTNHSIQLKIGDSFYLFSDGFMDQFGGENGKKYKYSRFRNFLLSIQEQGMEVQGQNLEEEFTNWKGNLEQLDDVCIIGVKL